jgi:hypothetical protein
MQEQEKNWGGMTVREEMIKGIYDAGIQKKGRVHLVNYLKGKQLTQNEAIQAYCYHCKGYGAEDDCEQYTCPLYPFAPYSTKRQKKGIKK